MSNVGPKIQAVVRPMEKEMKSEHVKSLDGQQVQDIRKRWLADSTFIGFPDAERDTVQNQWFDNLLVQPDWFSNAISTTATAARKGAGKSAVRLTSIERASKARFQNANSGSISGRTRLATRGTLGKSHGARIRSRLRLDADLRRLICRRLAHEMSGRLLTNDDEIALRAWAKTKGITERDFGERIVDVLKTLVPWAKQVSAENAEQQKDSAERISRVTQATSFALVCR